jgi:hypothetical protein
MKSAKKGTVLVVSALLGCNRTDTSYMPLQPGKKWLYSVSSGLLKDVVTVQVSGRQSVAGLEGYVLLSDFGRTTLAWQDQTLVASELANSRFSPPIPILNVAKIPGMNTPKDDPLVVCGTWSGKVETPGKLQPAMAKLRQRTTVLEARGGSRKCAESVAEISIGKASVELRTWFAPNEGIVSQEQYSNRRIVLRLDLINSD